MPAPSGVHYSENKPFRDGYLIDVKYFDCHELIRAMDDGELGRFIRLLNACYLSGDHDFVASFPFIPKVYPISSSTRRRHIPLRIREEVLSSGPCVTCGTYIRLTVDHKIPVSKGGSDDPSNLQPMCLTCNIRKLNRV